MPIAEDDLEKMLLRAADIAQHEISTGDEELYPECDVSDQVAKDVIALVAEVRRLRAILAAGAEILTHKAPSPEATNTCGTVVAYADRPLFRCKRIYNHDGPCSPRKG